MPDGPGCFRLGSTCLAVLRIPLSFHFISTTGLAPPLAGLSMPFVYEASFSIVVLQPRSLDRFGLLPFRSPLLRESLLFSSPAGTKMFQFPALPHHDLFVPHVFHIIACDGFPHSDISGSLIAFISPERFADCCVLLLLSMPRHPPYALSYLIIHLFSLLISSELFFSTFP